MISIESLPILLLKDYRQEYFTLPKSQGSNFAPVINIDTYSFPAVSLIKKDPLCYIKHKTKDLWLYENKDGSLEFKHLQRDYEGFATFKQPTFFFIDYLEEPTFILYRPVKYGVNYFLFLVCDLGPGNNMDLYWADKAQYATRFFYNIIEWREYLTENIAAKVFFAGKYNKLAEDVEPYIRK